MSKHETAFQSKPNQVLMVLIILSDIFDEFLTDDYNQLNKFLDKAFSFCFISFQGIYNLVEHLISLVFTLESKSIKITKIS